MSAYTLFDIAYRVARELGVAHEGTATGGSTTTTIDTVFLKNNFRDDFFNGGTVFIVSHVLVIPSPTAIGQYARVTDSVSSTGVLTHGAFTTAVTSGDIYAVCNNEYRLDTIIQNINSALGEMLIPTVDITTLETDSDKTEYALSSAMISEPIRIWIQRSTTTNHNLWIEYFDWYLAETATGTVKKLIFRTQPPQPWDIKIEYWQPHPALYAYSDKLAESININRIVGEATLKCLIWKKVQKAQDDPILDQRIAEMMARVGTLRSRYPNNKPGVKLATYGITNNFDFGDD